MIVEMSRVFVVGLKKDLQPVLETMADFGKVHLGDMSSDLVGEEIEVAAAEVPLLAPITDERFEELSARAASVRVGLDDLLGEMVSSVDERGGDNPYAAMPRQDLVHFMAGYLDTVEPQARKLATAMEELALQAAELERFGPILEKVSPLVDEMVTSKAVDSVALLFDQKYSSALPKFGEALRELSEGHATVASKRIPGEDTLLVMVLIDDPEWSTRVRNYLTDEGMNRVSLPGNLQELPFNEAVKQAMALHAAMPGRLRAAEAEVQEFYTENSRKLNWLAELTDDDVAETVEVKYGESAFSFVIEGYLPTRDLPEFEELMENEWGDAVKVDVVPIEHEDYPKVPVLQENAGASGHFQTVAQVWGSPKYGTIDPSAILRWSFPFVFGLIVGDFGYGLLLTCICLFVRWKWKDSYMAQVFASVLLPAGIMTMIFGVIYWEMFGDLPVYYIPYLRDVSPYMFFEGFGLPFMRAKPEFRQTYLFIAIGFGFIHVVIGLILGIINSKKMKKSKHVWEKAGILIILLSIVMLAAFSFVPALVSGLPPVAAAIITYILYIAIAFGVISVLFGGGIMGAIETIEAVGNVASYIRIMAVGLVGALLADSANQLAFVTMPGAGGIIIALVLHIVNFIIICFSPSIHALRLNFLEFFGKFWEAGSVTYQPLARKGDQS